MKKTILLITIILFILSNTVFALGLTNTFDSNTYVIKTNNNNRDYYYTSNKPFVYKTGGISSYGPVSSYNSQGQLQYKDFPGFDANKFDSTLLVDTSHHIYYDSTNQIFFRGPALHWMKATQEELAGNPIMAQILLILPIILGLILLATGLRKALILLFRVLRVS